MGSIISICLAAPDGTLHMHVHLSQALGAGAEEGPMRKRAGAATGCAPGPARLWTQRYPGPHLGQGRSSKKWKDSCCPGAACIGRPLKILFITRETKCHLQKRRCHLRENEVPLGRTAVTGSSILTQRKIECGTKTSLEMLL